MIVFISGVNCYSDIVLSNKDKFYSACQGFYLINIRVVLTMNPFEVAHIIKKGSNLGFCLIFFELERILICSYLSGNEILCFVGYLIKGN
jgi:hypothetical protein